MPLLLTNQIALNKCKPIGLEVYIDKTDSLYLRLLYVIKVPPKFSTEPR